MHRTCVLPNKFDYGTNPYDYLVLKYLLIAVMEILYFILKKHSRMQLTLQSDTFPGSNGKLLYWLSWWISSLSNYQGLALRSDVLLHHICSLFYKCRRTVIVWDYEACIAYTIEIICCEYFNNCLYWWKSYPSSDRLASVDCLGLILKYHRLLKSEAAAGRIWIRFNF